MGKDGARVGTGVGHGGITCVYGHNFLVSKICDSLMSLNIRKSGIRILKTAQLCKNAKVSPGSYHLNKTDNIWIQNAF